MATALLTVLQRMHTLGVIHRDVKLENIFIGEHSASATVPRICRCSHQSSRSVLVV